MHSQPLFSLELDLFFAFTTAALIARWDTKLNVYNVCDDSKYGSLLYIYVDKMSSFK